MFKEGLNTNNLTLQDFIEYVNNLPGDNNTEDIVFTPADSDLITFKGRIKDNNIDLQSLLEICKSMPQDEFLKILYNANGGIFENNNLTNMVTYKHKSLETKIKISKTPNVNSQGFYDVGYPNSSFFNEIKIPGATALKLSIWYDTESNYDYIYIYDGSLSKDDIQADEYGSLATYYLTGEDETQMDSGTVDEHYALESDTGPYNVKTADVLYFETQIPGDTVYFKFESNGSINEYLGYYAIIEPVNTIIEIVEGNELIPIKQGQQFAGWYLEPQTLNKLDMTTLTFNTKVWAKFVDFPIDFNYNIFNG